MPPSTQDDTWGAYKLVDRIPRTTDDGNVKLEEKDDESFSTEDERRLVRKLDRRIMPCLFAMIVLNYLDRNSLANARVQGLEKSLDLKDSQFNTAISIFFIGYIGLQIPSNLLITRVRPSLYLPGCMIAWGTLSGLTTLATGFKSLITIRFLLGIVEAPFFPGALFFLSSWYTKKELAFRTSMLYSGSLLAGAFGGFMAASIEFFLHNFLGIASWRWLYIIEASCTILLAISAMFILPDYPNTTKFLSPEERTLAITRLQTGSPTKMTRKSNLLTGLKLALLDYKVWLLALIIITKTSASAVTSFIPTLIATLSTYRVTTLLLIAPPYIFAAVLSLGVSRISDRLGERAYHIVGPMVFAICGFGVAAVTMISAAKYLSLFAMLGGVYGSYNVALAWISSTVSYPAEKRSAAIAIINTAGNVAQIYSPYFYLPQNGPRYLSAMVANMFFCGACIAVTLFLRRCLRRENLELAREQVLGDEEDFMEEDLSFRYIL